MKVLVYSNFSNFFEIYELHKEWKISPSQIWRGNSQRAFLKRPYSCCHFGLM
jgi:hypothetical protein